MRKKLFWALVAVCVIVPAGAVSASEWEPEREYSEFAVDPTDEARYGGYTVGEQGYIDVLAPDGTVTGTIELPTPEGFTTFLYDLDTSGDLLIASYSVHLTGGDAFFDPDFFALSLYRNEREIARGRWGGHPYAETGQVALNDSSVFVSYSDTGAPEGPFVISIADIPAVMSDAEDADDFDSIPVDWNSDFQGDHYPGMIDMSASNESLFLYFAPEYMTGPHVEMYSFPDLKMIGTIELDVPESAVLRAIDHGPIEGFVASGWMDGGCNISTYGPDGFLQECFSTGPSDSADRDPFDVDACGGIVAADADRPTDNGVLTGFKFIPSNRDPGCFVDSLDSTFVSSIGVMGRSGITRGCNPQDNDRYCPDDYVTRGQMAAFLVRALELPPTLLDIFSDDDGSTYEDDINRLASAQITFGCGAGGDPWTGTYCPDDYVTRGQMAAFLVRAFKLPVTTLDYFSDDAGNTFEGDINRLAEVGVTKGCNPPANDLYCPDDYVTRGQMAAFLDRALNG